jgi:peptidylprolyl isomerase
MNRMTLGIVLLLSIGLAVPLVACGGGEEAGPTPTVPATQGAGGPPAVSGTPTVTADGLQIIDVVVGTGASAEPSQTVEVNYTGWLADGTKFGSSLDSGQTFSFVLGAGNVIAGWDEGVAGMKVGGERRLIIPPALAYGEAGRPPVIPGNAQLTFDVQLVSIQQ